MNNIGKIPTNCICRDGNTIPATLFRRRFKGRGSPAFRQIKMPPLPTFRHTLPAASALRARCTEKIQVRTN
ncbi:TPA: hypothetical protein ACKMVI_001951, partial [Neisseria gonorrhoeae]